jgi:cyclopropane fatty-acyl-phospholipid synthase-like methyltransferase
MSGATSDKGRIPEAGASEAALFYKKDFWREANLKFVRPWYRVEKSARIINGLVQGRTCTLLDVGCGPAAALMRLLPQNVDYYGIDIAIQDSAPNLLEADLLESPIAFDDKRFDIVIAQGVFEYMGQAQSQKFAEIAQLLNEDGKFIVSYTNFSHRKTQVYEAFSNVQPFGAFRDELARFFTIERYFPASHNWKHSQPDRRFVKAVNMHLNANIPLISPVLAVDYFFICTPLAPGPSGVRP